MLSSPMKNCMSCALFLRCKDPLKSVIYSCNSYSKGRDKGLSGMTRMFDALDMGLPDVLHPRRSQELIVPSAGLDDFDIHSVVKSAVAENALVARDLRVDDGDFELAPNFYEFCVSSKFLKIKPYVSQALIGTKLFAEYCPYCSDTEYFDSYNAKDSLSKFTSKIALLTHGKCSACGRTKETMVRKGKLNLYEELAVSAGQRSGKSAVVAMLSGYIVHRVIKLQNPNAVYGLMKSNVLHGTFVALTYAQAKDTLWDPFYGNIQDSPWFNEYFDMLDEHQSRTGENLYKLNDTFLHLKHRRILLYPAGPDKRTLRGRTRFLGGIDEIGWFDNSADSSKVKLSAAEVYIALERSLLTVRAKAKRLASRGFHYVPTAYFLNVSSPSSVRDKIMELVRKSVGSKKILGLIRPTWMMNPDIRKKDLAEEFRADPIAAMRDYGAEPPISSNQFISNTVASSGIGSKKNAVVIKHQLRKSKTSSDVMRYGTIEKVRRTGKASVLALDAGLVNNSFAGAIGHRVDHKFPMIDAVFEIQPIPGAKINFSLVYKNVIVPLLEARNVMLVCADRWNSAKILSDIEEDHGIATRQYSLKYRDMRMFKDYLEDKKLVLPDPGRDITEIVKYDQSSYPACFKDDAIGHFYLQLITVQDTGASVIKGDQLTDDMVRAAMLANYMLLDESNDEYLNADREEEVVATVDVTTLASFRGYSGGSSSGSRASTSSSGSSALGSSRSLSR